MFENFTPLLSALCIATLSDLSDFAQKNAASEKVVLAKTYTDARTVHLFSSVINETASQEQLNDCQEIAEKKILNITENLVMLEYFATLAMVDFFSETGDIDKCRQNILLLAKKLKASLEFDFTLLEALQAAKLFDKLLTDFLTLKNILVQAITEIDSYMLHIFNAHIMPTLKPKMLQASFIYHSYKLHKKIDHKTAKLELFKNMLLATLKFWAYSEPEVMFSKNTEMQRKIALNFSLDLVANKKKHEDDNA